MSELSWYAVINGDYYTISFGRLSKETIPSIGNGHSFGFLKRSILLECHKVADDVEIYMEDLYTKTRQHIDTRLAKKYKMKEVSGYTNIDKVGPIFQHADNVKKGTLLITQERCEFYDSFVDIGNVFLYYFDTDDTLLADMITIGEHNTINLYKYEDLLR